MRSELPPSLVPLIPPAILRKHRAHRPSDTRFRACARLLQSLWRQRAGLAAGMQPAPGRPARRLGSLLSQQAAEQGRNFLLPAVAQLARRAVIYRERSAFLEEDRLFRNLLSSMPLAFNLFAPLRLSPALAARVLHALLPALGISAVNSFRFEHAPRPRRSVSWPDRTALDVVATYTTDEGKRGFIGFEVKYSEAMASRAATGACPDYTEHACRSGLFLAPDDPALRRAPLEQLFREHLLIHRALAEGQWDQACFVLIAPRDNVQVQEAAASYAAQLAGARQPVPFINLHLEEVIAALAAAGEPAYAQGLHQRYTDWRAVRALIEAELTEQQPGWDLVLGPGDQPLALPGTT